jgi:hypothetical protein
VRDETPAHVCAQLRWLAPAPMAEFAAAHAVWLQRWRDHRRAELGL